MNFSKWPLLLIFLVVPFLSSAVYGQSDTAVAEGPDRPLRIRTKPRARYTDAGRQDNVQGTVKLEVEFLADGKIGTIVCINDDNENTKKLKESGLVSEAIRAAKKITFDPELREGNAVSVKRTQFYTFTIY